MWARLPASFSACWRRRTSPARLAGTRSTSPASSARLVMTPATWGRAAKGGEGRPALVVDQHHPQPLGGMGGGQGQDQGAEQLALARAGGPDAQPVGAHAQLGRL